MTSSVSVTSSPIFESLCEPQHSHAGARRGHHDTLARQVIGEWLAPGPAPGEPLDPRRPGRRLFGCQFVRGRARLKLVELEFQLVEEALLALRSLAASTGSRHTDLAACSRYRRTGLASVSPSARGWRGHKSAPIGCGRTGGHNTRIRRHPWARAGIVACTGGGRGRATGPCRSRMRITAGVDTGGGVERGPHRRTPFPDPRTCFSAARPPGPAGPVRSSREPRVSAAGKGRRRSGPKPGPSPPPDRRRGREPAGSGYAASGRPSASACRSRR